MPCRLFWSLIPISLVVIFHSSSALSVSEKDCIEVRLDQNGGPYSKLPVYHQVTPNGSDLNLCYAISASQLIDAKRIVEGKFNGQLTSPVAIGLNLVASLYDKDTSKATQELFREKRQKIRTASINNTRDLFYVPGLAGPVIEAARNKYVCDHNWLKEKSVISTKDHDLFLQKIFTLIDTQIEAKESTTAVYERLMQMPDLDFSGGCDMSHDGFDQIKDILAATKEASTQVTPFQQATAFIDRLCEGHSHLVDVPAPKELLCLPPFTEGMENGCKSKKEQAQLLNDLISSPKFSGVAFNYGYDLLYKNKVGSGGAHVSVIIGRQWNKDLKQCQVLVRDSYGKSCKSKVAEFKDCKDGQHWVSFDELIAESPRFTYFE